MRNILVLEFNTFDEYWKWKQENKEYREVNLNERDGKFIVGVMLYE